MGNDSDPSAVVDSQLNLIIKYWWDKTQCVRTWKLLLVNNEQRGWLRVQWKNFRWLWWDRVSRIWDFFLRFVEWQIELAEFKMFFLAWWAWNLFHSYPGNLNAPKTQSWRLRVKVVWIQDSSDLTKKQSFELKYLSDSQSFASMCLLLPKLVWQFSFLCLNPLFDHLLIHHEQDMHVEVKWDIRHLTQLRFKPI